MLDITLLLLGQEEDADKVHESAISLSAADDVRAKASRRAAGGAEPRTQPASVQRGAARISEDLSARSRSLQRAALELGGVVARSLRQQEQLRTAQLADLPGRSTPGLPLYAQLRERERQLGFVQTRARAQADAEVQRQAVAAVPAAAPGLSVQALDRALERDARRYAQGFTLY